MTIVGRDRTSQETIISVRSTFKAIQPFGREGSHAGSKVQSQTSPIVKDCQEIATRDGYSIDCKQVTIKCL
jgi:hypothetical protein